jgi:simple sugar transport system substrate-binding protein
MKRTVLFLMMVAVALAPIFATGQQETQQTDDGEQTAEEQPEIAVVVKISGIPWFNRMQAGVEEAGGQLNVNAYQQGPSNAEAAPQVQIVEDLISRGVDAIAVVPNDADALQPAFERARRQGIVVLTHESPFNTTGVDYDVETIDQEQYARNAVDEFVADLEEEGDRDQYSEENPAGLVHLVGSLTVPLHNFWADTANEYIEENYPFIEILTERLPVAESVDESRSGVLDLITTYGDDLRGVIGWGSLGPIGASQAVRQRNMQEELYVGGAAIPSTVAQYLEDDSADYIQLWDPRDAGFAMVYIASQMVRGNEIEEGQEIPGLGPISIDDKVISVNAIREMPTAEAARELGF